MYRRHALIVGLAGVLSACASPAPTPTPPPAPAATAASTSPPAAPTPPAPTPVGPTPAVAATPASATPTAVVSAPPAAAMIPLDVRLWNGDARIHLDGREIQPGRIEVPAGQHHLAALVDDEVVAAIDPPREGGRVDLIVPPAHASLAIMVENQEQARPQSGLTHADVVYEALAEGGITRFIAVFLSGDANKVGPVRSLRHYFAFLAADYGADLVHIGASPEGFAWRDAMNLGKLDESADDPGVWRVSTRRPPHNAYTDTAADRLFLAERGRQRNRLWGPLRFSSEAPRGADPATSVTLRFRPWPYRVGYEWDAEHSRYLRSVEGAAHLDLDTGERIAPTSVVLQYAKVEAIPNDEKLRLDVDLVGGSGELVVLSGGTARHGSWSKAAPRAASVWLDDAGEPMTLPPGQVWVEVLPLGSPVSITGS